MSSYSQSSDGWTCDGCGKPMATPLFCDRCGADYPERRGMSAFGILGLPPTFALKDSTIDQLESTLATRLHPDLWLQRGASLHRKALIAQSAVNEAIQAIRLPFTRAETLLSILADSEGPTESARSPLPTTFLVGQLKLQEEIEDGITPHRKRELTRSVRAELKQLHSLLDSEFDLVEKTSDTDGRNAAFLRIQNTVDRSRYWRSIQRSLRGPAPH